jgi:site-specific recombinase XerD
MTRLRRDYIQRLELKRFSERTITGYVGVVAKLAGFHGCSPLSLTSRQVRDFLYDELKVKKLSAATINLHIGSLKSFYRMMAPDSEVMKGISAMKVPEKLPVVLTREETAALLGALSNIKHRAILELMYSSGIRLAECLELVPADIQRENLLLRVRRGKGEKERYTIISGRALDTLGAYYRAARPRKYLFEGRGAQQYCRRSIGKIVSDAAKRAAIAKRVSPHTLRHSFATHLLETGVSLRVIQKLPGHRSIKTTTIYTHVSNRNISNLTNPLDTLSQEVAHAQ